MQNKLAVLVKNVLFLTQEREKHQAVIRVLLERLNRLEKAFEEKTTLFQNKIQSLEQMLQQYDAGVAMQGLMDGLSDFADADNCEMQLVWQPESSDVADGRAQISNHGEVIDSVFIDAENKAFCRAFDLVEHGGKSVFITGKAGTGKTTFLKYLIQKTKKKHIVLSLTGVAAVNVGGVTIHSFFQLGFQPYLPKDKQLDKDNLKYRREKINIIRELELIIIDEISMVRSDTLEAISQILKTYRGNTQPFGGVQMVFVGDLFQLAPIADKGIWEDLTQFYQSEYFFDAPVLQSLSYECIELEKIYRQNDAGFIDLLNKVRVNRLSAADYALLNRRCLPEQSTGQDGYIMLATHRYKVDSVNKSRLSALSGKEYAFQAVLSGKFNEKDAPAEICLNIKVGAQVMLLRNKSLDSGQWIYFNGSMGVVVEIGSAERFVDSSDLDENGQPISVVEDCIGIRLFENNEVVHVFREVWQKYEYRYDAAKKEIVAESVGTFIQFPVCLAWAITIHKSQGLTFDKVVVDVEKAFSHGQTYVALSRCCSLEGLILKYPIVPECIIVDKRVCAFLEHFSEPVGDDVDDIPF